MLYSESEQYLCTCMYYISILILISVVDINECVEHALNDTLLCEENEICENFPGRYQCSCPLGTHKVEDGCIAG